LHVEWEKKDFLKGIKKNPHKLKKIKKTLKLNQKFMLEVIE